MPCCLYVQHRHKNFSFQNHIFFLFRLLLVSDQIESYTPQVSIRIVNRFSMTLSANNHSTPNDRNSQPYLLDEHQRPKDRFLSGPIPYQVVAASVRYASQNRTHRSPWGHHRRDLPRREHAWTGSPPNPPMDSLAPLRGPRIGCWLSPWETNAIHSVHCSPPFGHAQPFDLTVSRRTVLSVQFRRQNFCENWLVGLAFLGDGSCLCLNVST